MTAAETIEALQVLGVPPGSVIVLRGDAWEDQELLTQMLEELHRALGHKLFLVVTLPDADDTVEVLDEDEMRAHGWVRA